MGMYTKLFVKGQNDRRYSQFLIIYSPDLYFYVRIQNTYFIKTFHKLCTEDYKYIAGKLLHKASINLQMILSD